MNGYNCNSSHRFLQVLDYDYEGDAEFSWKARRLGHHGACMCLIHTKIWMNNKVTSDNTDLL